MWLIPTKKLAAEKRGFIKQLDKVTLLAAKGESRYQTFSDVIVFDMDRDIKYFATLWRGNPPMASVNPSYSKQARELQSSIIAKIKAVNCKPLSSVCQRINDLWKALLHESFVFSFKNSLELEEYKTLDALCNQLKWKMFDELVEWEQQIGNIIDTSNDFNLEELSHNLSKLIDKQQQFVIDDLESYRKRKKIVYFQPEFFKEKLIAQSEKFKSEALERCSQHSDGRKLVAKIHLENLRYEQQIAIEVCDFASRLSGDLSEREMQEHFDEWWEKKITDIERVYSFKPKTQVATDIENALVQFVGPANQQLLLDLKEKKGNDEFDALLNLKLENAYILKVESPDAILCQQQEHELVISDKELERIVNDKIKQCVDDYLERVRCLPYTPNYITELLRKVNQALEVLRDTLSTELKKPLFFTDGFCVYLYFMTSYYAGNMFETILTEFLKKNDPLLNFEANMKEIFFTRFKDEYKQVDLETKFARPFCQKLFDRVETQIRKSLSLIVIKKIRNKLPNKQVLKSKVLIDLANKNTFEDFMLYLENPDVYMEQWIKEYIREHCEQPVDDEAEQTLLQQVAIRELNFFDSFIANKTNESFDAFASVNEVSTKEWLRNFFDDQMRSKLGDIVADNVLIIDATILFTRFTQIVLNELAKSKKELERKFQKFTYNDDMEWTGMEELFLVDIIGCRAQCPYCKEICDHATRHLPGMKHSISQHRPVGLGGFYSVGPKPELSLSFCNQLVAGRERFRQYKDSEDSAFHTFTNHSKRYPTWSIPVDLSSPNGSLYWRWFVASHIAEIQNHFKVALEEVPDEWADLEWPEVEGKLHDAQ